MKNINYAAIDKVIDLITPYVSNNSDLYLYILNGDYSYAEVPVAKDICDVLSDNHILASCHNGLSKLVITSPTFGDAVIKLPIYSLYDDCYDSDTVYDVPYSKAAAADPSDYCMAELEKYNTVKKIGLEFFLAETVLYKTINDTPVYLQEYIEVDSEVYAEHEPSKGSLSKAKELNSYHSGILPDSAMEWIGCCIDFYGEDAVDDFLDYCDTKDKDILDDFHYNNYGYRLNGEPCILDYSNYNE